MACQVDRCSAPGGVHDERERLLVQPPKPQLGWDVGPIDAAGFELAPRAARAGLVTPDFGTAMGHDVGQSLGLRVVAADARAREVF